MKNKALILTGPGGSGKSTIAKLLIKKHNFVLVDGDQEDTEFFPNGKQWLPENIDNLSKAHDKILQKAKALFDQGKSVVVDYIIFGDYKNFINKFRNEFGDNLEIKVLFPSEEEMIKRDSERKSWTTGADRIRAVRKEFKDIESVIGKENYIDTSRQSPEQTLIDIL